MFMVDSRRHRAHPANCRRTDGLAAHSKVAIEDAAFVIVMVQLPSGIPVNVVSKHSAFHSDKDGRHSIYSLVS
jgi:hypothetical protein